MNFGCANCKHHKDCLEDIDEACGLCCKGDRWEAKPQSNADRIRSMTDEELAEYMGDVQTWGGCPNHGARNCQEDCSKCWLDWLRQEASDAKD